MTVGDGWWYNPHPLHVFCEWPLTLRRYKTNIPKYMENAVSKSICLKMGPNYARLWKFSLMLAAIIGVVKCWYLVVGLQHGVETSIPISTVPRRYKGHWLVINTPVGLSKTSIILAAILDIRDQYVQIRSAIAWNLNGHTIIYKKHCFNCDYISSWHQNMKKIANFDRHLGFLESFSADVKWRCMESERAYPNLYKTSF